MSKIQIGILLFLSFFTITARSGDKDTIKKHLLMRLDSLSKHYNVATDSVSNELRTNPEYYKMFVPTVLYKSTVKRGVSHGFDFSSNSLDGSIEFSDSRDAVIDRLLFNVYRNNPEKVRMSEDEMRNAFITSDFEQTQASPEIELKENVPVALPENVEGALETKIVKPNYWRTSGSVSFSFTQNYVSDNWAQGGENNRNLITTFKFNVKYNDKKKISFESIVEAKLGFTTVSGDSLHGYRTNNDMLRVESKFGYKIMTNVDLSAKMTMQTQFMPNYPVNSNEFVSKFMAPFEANFSLGFDYKRSGKNWDLSVFFAPLSSYNYKFVKYGYLAERYGINARRHHTENFGTQIQPTFNATLLENVKWSARMQFYTDYARTYFNWENTITMKINKYLNTTLFLHGRFDDSSPGLYSESHGYWQLKEYMSLGITYSW